MDDSFLVYFIGVFIRSAVIYTGETYAEMGRALLQVNGLEEDKVQLSRLKEFHMRKVWRKSNNGSSSDLLDRAANQ